MESELWKHTPGQSVATFRMRCSRSRLRAWEDEIFGVRRDDMRFFIAVTSALKNRLNTQGELCSAVDTPRL